MKICVMDVGHGLCMPICVGHSEIEVFTQRYGIFDKDFIKAEHALIDCGSGTKGSYEWVSSKALLRANMYIRGYAPKYFILSHFHYDHYNGIVNMAKNNIKKDWFDDVYLPGIPTIIEDRNNKLRDKFILACLTLNLIQTYRKFGIAPIDVLDAINKIRGKRCNPKYCFEDDEIKIGNKVFKVLNPPKLVENKDVVKSVRDIIKKFENLKDKFEELEKIYGFVEKNSLICKSIIKDEIEENKNKKCEKSYKKLDENSIEDTLEEIKKKINSDKKLRKNIEDLDDEFRKITNRLSLAFYCNYELLFMGDLEAWEINRVVKKLKNLNKPNKPKFCVLITPHHGTHWGNKLKDIECRYAISSNGEEYKDKFEENKPKFKSISEYYLSTLEKGDIIISLNQYPMCLFPWKRRYFPFLIL